MAVPRLLRAGAGAATALGLLLGGCAVGPDYRRPPAETPAGFSEAGLEPGAPWRVAVPKDHLPKGAWWTIYGDPVLDRLAQQATGASPTIQAAVARRDQARATARIDGADAFPALAVDASATRSRTAANRRTGAAGSVGNSFVLPVDASYELDLWGRVRRTRESAAARAEAADADYHAVLLGVQADAVRAYVSLRALDVERDLVQRTAASRQRSLDIVRKQVALGAVGPLDASLAETDLATAQGDLVAIDQNRAALRHGLAVLCGTLPESFTLAADPSPLAAPPAIPIGLPSELLERRPDVATDERLLASASAQIGIAEAAFFPSVTLFGSVGYSSSSAGSLLDWSSRIWSIGPGVTLPLFQGGRLTANRDRAEAAYAEAVANYRQAVLTAFQEVESALSDVARLRERAEFTAQAVRSSRRAADLTGQRYRAGQVGYLDVIAAERIAIANERLQVQLQGQQLVATVVLIKALGGGW